MLYYMGHPCFCREMQNAIDGLQMVNVNLTRHSWLTTARNPVCSAPIYHHQKVWPLAHNETEGMELCCSFHVDSLRMGSYMDR